MIAERPRGVLKRLFSAYEWLSRRKMLATPLRLTPYSAKERTLAMKEDSR